MSEEKKGLRIVVPKMVQQTKVYLGDEDVTEKLLPKSIRIEKLTAESGMSKVHLECYADEVVLEDVRSSLKYVELFEDEEANRITDQRSEPTIGQVRRALIRLKEVHGPKSAVALLHECDVDTLSQLDKDHYGWILDQVRMQLEQPDGLTLEQIGEASGLIRRRAELNDVINMLDRTNGKNNSNPLMRVSVGSTTDNKDVNIYYDNIRGYMVQELDCVERRLKALKVIL